VEPVSPPDDYQKVRLKFEKANHRIQFLVAMGMALTIVLGATAEWVGVTRLQSEVQASEQRGVRNAHILKCQDRVFDQILHDIQSHTKVDLPPISC